MCIAGFVSMFFAPFRTLLWAGYFVGIMMFVFGVNGIIRAFKKESSVLDTVSSILALIVGVVALIKPGSTLMIDVIIVYSVAAFFLIRGILSAVISIRLKGISSLWYLGLIIGILSAILGIFSFLHPYATAELTGMLIGLYFLESGIDIIATALTVKKIEKIGEVIS